MLPVHIIERNQQLDSNNIQNHPSYEDDSIAPYTLNCALEECLACFTAGHAIVKTRRNIAAHQTQSPWQLFFTRIGAIVAHGEFIIAQRRG